MIGIILSQISIKGIETSRVKKKNRRKNRPGIRKTKDLSSDLISCPFYFSFKKKREQVTTSGCCETVMRDDRKRGLGGGDFSHLRDRFRRFRLFVGMSLCGIIQDQGPSIHSFIQLGFNHPKSALQ